jgi:hypothetical protein
VVIGTESSYTLTEDDASNTAVTYSVEVTADGVTYTGALSDTVTSYAPIDKQATVKTEIYDKTQGRKIADITTLAVTTSGSEANATNISYGSPAIGDELEVRTTPAAAAKDMNFTWTGNDASTGTTVTLGTGTTYTVGEIKGNTIAVTGTFKDPANDNWNFVGTGTTPEAHFATNTKSTTGKVAKPLTGMNLKYKKVYAGDGTNPTHVKNAAILDANKDEQFVTEAEVGTLLDAKTIPEVGSSDTMEYRLYKDEVSAANQIDPETWKPISTAAQATWKDNDKNEDGVHDAGNIDAALPTIAIPNTMAGHKIFVVAAYVGGGDYAGAYVKSEFDVVESSRTLSSVEVQQNVDNTGYKTVTTLTEGFTISLANLKTSDGETITQPWTVPGVSFKWVDTTDNVVAGSSGYVPAQEVKAEHHYKLTVTPNGIDFVGDPVVVEFDADATTAQVMGAMFATGATPKAFTPIACTVSGANVTGNITTDNAKKGNIICPSASGIKLTSIDAVSYSQATSGTGVVAHADADTGVVLDADAAANDTITFKTTYKNVQYTYTLTVVPQN